MPIWTTFREPPPRTIYGIQWEVDQLRKRCQLPPQNSPRPLTKARREIRGEMEGRGNEGPRLTVCTEAFLSWGKLKRYTLPRPPTHTESLPGSWKSTVCGSAEPKSTQSFPARPKEEAIGRNLRLDPWQGDPVLPLRHSGTHLATSVWVWAGAVPRLRAMSGRSEGYPGGV